MKVPMDAKKSFDADKNARQDEIEALGAIYPGDIELKEDEMVPTLDGEWKLHNHRGAIINIRPMDDLDPARSTPYTVRLDISTPPDYPSYSAPTYRLLIYYYTMISILK